MATGRSFKKILKISREAASDCPQPLPKPAWLKVRASVAGGAEDPIRDILSSYSLSTVCREASCPNRAECFSHGTAAFLILGELCTRRCAFCDLAHGTPKPPAADEPHRVAQAVKALKLRYVVITSPDRDDLKDGGAGHFAAVISQLRKNVEGIEVEILVPDFKKKEDVALRILSEMPPDVFNHNIETVPRLYRVARPGASYEGSLALLKAFAEQNPHIPTKSGLMLGLGETDEEVMEVLRDLRLHKFFNLRLIPSLHLGERTLTYMNDIDDELFKTTIKSTCITVPLYIKYSAVRVKNYRPYLLVGGGVNFDLAHDKTKPILLDYTDYFIEFGFGWTIYFEYFRLSPEIKFAIGFNNVHTSWEDRKHENGYLDPEHQKYNDALSRLTSRMFTLVFNFE